jgi:hypothetical protein
VGRWTAWSGEPSDDPDRSQVMPECLAERLEKLTPLRLKKRCLRVEWGVYERLLDGRQVRWLWTVMRLRDMGRWLLRTGRWREELNGRLPSQLTGRRVTTKPTTGRLTTAFHVRTDLPITVPKSVSRVPPFLGVRMMRCLHHRVKGRSAPLVLGPLYLLLTKLADGANIRKPWARWTQSHAGSQSRTGRPGCSRGSFVIPGDTCNGKVDPV